MCLFVLSLPLTGLKLIRSLESQAGPYADAGSLAGKGVQCVVVLSGEFREGNLTAADRLGCSVLRLMEGVRLWRGIPRARLIVTGGRTPGLSRQMSIAEAMRDAAVEMGVPRDAIVLEDRSWTTSDQARLTAPIVGKEPFVLVTSAYHLPRSLLLFRLAGLKPIPAPCEFLTKKLFLDYSTLVPQAHGIALSEIAIKEHLLTWWFKLKARFMGTATQALCPDAHACNTNVLSIT
jgi:uncharacterized SAM-binding protein YcdF (DUF218 family)